MGPWGTAAVGSTGARTGPRPSTAALATAATTVPRIEASEGSSHSSRAPAIGPAMVHQGPPPGTMSTGARAKAVSVRPAGPGRSRSTTSVSRTRAMRPSRRMRTMRPPPWTRAGGAALPSCSSPRPMRSTWPVMAEVREGPRARVPVAASAARIASPRPSIWASGTGSHRGPRARTSRPGTVIARPPTAVTSSGPGGSSSSASGGHARSRAISTASARRAGRRRSAAPGRLVLRRSPVRVAALIVPPSRWRRGPRGRRRAASRPSARPRPSPRRAPPRGRCGHPGRRRPRGAGPPVP